MMKQHHFRSVALAGIFSCTAVLAETSATTSSEDETLWDYGKECAETLGVEVPRFNCLDGAEIPVTRNGVRAKPGERFSTCDKPASGSSGCSPGSRMLKFTDWVTRGTRREEVTTTILCRATAESPVGTFHDIAIIQHNVTNNKVCWFNSLTSQNATNVPPPFTRSVERDGNDAANAFWGPKPTNLNCMSCHNNGLYLRTPWIMQVDGVNKGSFEREGREGENGAYVKKGTNGFDDNKTIGQRGFACSIGKRHRKWNETLPRLMKINSKAFEDAASLGRPVGGETASPGLCTRCHYLGSGGLSCSLSAAAVTGHGVGETEKVSARGRSFPEGHWMPPQGGSDWRSHFMPAPNANRAQQAAVQRGFANYFRPAIEALMFCCNPENYEREFNGQKLCQGSFREFPNAQTPCAAPVAPMPRERRTH